MKTTDVSWRSRIGHGRIKTTTPTSPSTFDLAECTLQTISISLILVLLMIGNVESNPGPPKAQLAMAEVEENRRRLNELLSSSLLRSCPIQDFERQLAQIDYGLTTTINFEPEFSSRKTVQVRMQNGFTTGNGRNPSIHETRATHTITAENQTEDIALDTVILSLLHELNKDYSIILKFDDSLLKRPGEFNKLTSCLPPSANKHNFLADLMKIKTFKIKKSRENLDSESRETELIIGISRDKLIKVLDCFEQYFSVDFCLNFYFNGNAVQISSQKRTSEKRHVILKKVAPNPEFRAIVLRRDLYRDPRSYFTSIANDILRYKLFQTHFQKWANSKADLSSLMLETPEFYKILNECSSIDEIIDKIFPDNNHNVIFPLIKLRRLLKENNLDRAIVKDIIRHVKENISLEFNSIIQTMTAKKTEDENRNYQLFCDMEENAVRMLEEAKQFCELQEKRQIELSGELESLQSKQSKILENKDELKTIRDKIFMAKGYIDWTKFKCDLLHAQLKNNSFSGFDLDIIDNPVFTLSDIISHISIWFSVPSQSVTKSPEFLKYAEQNAGEMRSECIRILRHMRSVDSDVSFDKENATVEITGHHLNLSQALSKIPKIASANTANFTEMRIIAKGTLYLDKDIIAACKNVLICGNHVIVPKIVKINTSGTDGIPFVGERMTAEHAQNDGFPGEDGDNGDSGTSAGNVTIISKNEIMGEENLRIYADGGDGADGQNGGNGKDGRVGDDGKDGEIAKPGMGQVWGTCEDARRVSKEGTEGIAGGLGGKGGKPGTGGKAGQCGQILIKSGTEQHKYIEIQTENISCLNGTPGDPGDWGRFGVSGRGGRNGADHGYATESFWAWNRWEEGKGKLEFEEVRTFFKWGYKIIISQTEDQVHNTFATTEESEVNHAATSTNSGRNATRFCNPMRPINLDTANLQRFFTSTGQATHVEVNQAILEEEELQSRLIEISSTNNQASSLREQIQSNQREQECTQASLNEYSIKMARTQSEAERARLKTLDSLRKLEELREGMESLRKWEKEFLEWNKMTVQTQEQVQTRISSEFHNFKDDISPSRPRPLEHNFSLLSGEINFDSVHPYVIESKRILSNIEFSNHKSAFEECFQKCLFHSFNLNTKLPPNLFQFIEHQSVHGCPKGYELTDYVSKIFPLDLQVCLEFHYDKVFCNDLVSTCHQIIPQESSQQYFDPFQMVYNLRHWKPVFQPASWMPSFQLDSERTPIDELSAIVKKSTDPLKRILQDILERNCVELYVEAALKSQESSKPVKMLKKARKAQKRFVKYLLESEIDDGIPEETNNTNDAEEENAEEAEEYEDFDESEINEARSEVLNENHKRGIISESDIRHLAQTAVSVYKELKIFIPGLSLSECLNPNELDFRKLMTNGDAIWNFIRHCTGFNLLSIEANFRALCHPKNADNERLFNAIPFYNFILSKSNVDLPQLSDLHELSSDITRIHQLIELETNLYNMYLGRFQNSRIRRLKNMQNHNLGKIDLLEKVIESKYTGLNLMDRIRSYDKVLKSNSSSSDTATDVIKRFCTIHFSFHNTRSQLRDCLVLLNQSQTDVKHFISVIQSVVTQLLQKHSTIENYFHTLFPKLALHMHLEQMQFELNDFEQIGKLITKIETHGLKKESASATFMCFRGEFVKTLRTHLKTQLRNLSSIFDTHKHEDAGARARCQGIMELVTEYTNQISNEQRIIQHFEILLSRIHFNLVETGKCENEIDSLINEIVAMKSTCPEPKEFLSQLNVCCIEFLKGHSLPVPALCSDIHNLPFEDTSDTFNRNVIVAIKCIPDDYPDSLFSEVINTINSTFMSRHSFHSLQNLLFPLLSTNENANVGSLKQIIQSRIKQMATTTANTQTLQALKTFRDTLTWSTRTIYEEKIVARIRNENSVQDVKVKRTTDEITQILSKVFDLFLHQYFGIKNLVNFITLTSTALNDPNLEALTNNSLLDGIVRTFISELLWPGIVLRNSTNIPDTLYHTTLVFLKNTFQRNGIDEENASTLTSSETKEQEFARFKFYNIFEKLVEILGKTCWDYYTDSLKFISYLEQCYSGFSERKTKSLIVQPTMTLLTKLAQNLTKDETNSSLMYRKIIFHLMDDQPNYHFLVAKTFLKIKLEAKESGRELTEEECWACFYKISKNQRIYTRSSFSKVFGPFQKTVAFALTDPDITESERAFLCNVLENCPKDYKFNSEQIHDMKNYFECEQRIGNLSSTFWTDLLKSNITNFLTADKKMLLEEISKVLDKKDQIPLEIPQLLHGKNPKEWSKALRDYLLDKISAKFYGNSMTGEESEAAIQQLRTFHFFSRQNELEVGEQKFFSIMQILCHLFKNLGSPNNNYKITLLKYSAHISLNELEIILKSKLPRHWLVEILRARVFARINELFEGKERLQDLIAKIGDTLHKIKHGPIIEEFLLQLGDSLMKETAGNAEYIYGYLQDICSLLTPKKLTERLLQELSGSPLNSWKLSFRRVELSERGLSGITIALILNIESNASSPEITNKFLDNFKRYFQNGDESFLNSILSKIDSGEWFLSDKIFDIEGKITQNAIIYKFKQCAEEKKGKILEGEELVKELMADPINKHLVLHLTNSLIQDIQNVRRNLTNDYQFDTRIAPKKLSDWTPNDITKWSRQTKADLKDMSLSAKFENLMSQKAKILAVICRASSLIEQKYDVWDTQLLSVLIFLEGSRSSENETGRLGQISTGEGKTLITAILTIFWALAGAIVNIITSTHVLAEANEKETKELFAMFDIRVGNNCDKKCREGGDRERKNRYRNQVIYGDISSFQSDILQVENFGKDLFGNREPDFVFVDEVDSLFLDKGGHMLYISHLIPEFRYLRPIFVKIWEVINRSSEENVYESVKIVREELERDEILIPNFLTKFTADRMLTWVQNGYQAKRMREDDPYIVSDKEGRKVTIIDPDTGVEQPSMQYSFGLHQFIELKHYDRLSCESLKAIFMSNFSYFQRYRGKLYGITGTLGSEKSREIMARRYKVDFFSMKRRKVRYCPQEEGKVARNEGEWLEFIKEAVLQKINAGRAVLVIGGNVEMVKRIKAFLQPTIPNVQSYESSSDTNFINYIRENEVEVGTVIVGTNLAGRGTDLRISKTVLGGLHVIVAYMPANSRILGQAEGRTARKGEDGSTEFIVLSPHGDTAPTPSIEELRIWSEVQEDYRLEKMDTEQFKRVELEEQLFQKFREYSRGIENSEHFKKLSEQFKKLQFDFIRNRWAIWLDLMNERIKCWKFYGEENILKKFDEFKEEIEEAIQCNKLASAPSELVKLAKAHEVNGDIDNSIDLLTTAIKMELNFCEIPLYYKAACLLKKSPYSKDERQEAICLLKQARRLINTTIENYKLLPAALDGTNVKARKDEAGRNFAKQIANQCELLQKHINSIDAAVGVPVTSELFKRVTGVSDKAEAADLFEFTRKSINSVKSFRISKKIGIREGQLFVGENEIKLLQIYHYCQDEIVEIIAAAQLTPSKEIEPEAFQHVIMTKQKFWNILALVPAFQSEDAFDVHRIDYSTHSFAQIEFPDRFSIQKASVGLILMENDKRIFDKSILKNLDLTDIDIAIIEAFLKLYGILTPLKNITGNISPEFLGRIDFNANVYPEELRKYSGLLANWIRNEDGSLKSTIKILDQVPLLCDAEFVQYEVQNLWDELLKLGIIKECKINISIRRDFGVIVSKIVKIEKEIEEEEIKNEYVNIYDKYHGGAVAHFKNKDTGEMTMDEHTAIKEYHLGIKHYLASIKSVLRSSIGSLKSFERIHTDFAEIEENYKASNYPHEIVEFIMSDFERLIKFSESIVWWKSGGFIVSMLGILQIAVGIGLLFIVPNIGIGLLSEGLGDIYYGWSNGYTNPNFSWKDYAITKTISVGASAITCGLSGMSGGFTLQRLAMEVGEEAIKRTILKRALQSVGTQFMGALIHECYNRARDFVLRRFKDHFKTFLPNFPGYSTQLELLRTKLNQLLRVTFDSEQVMKILQDSFKFIWKDENSVFRANINNLMARVVPQIVRGISSAITGTGTAFLKTFDLVIQSFQWQKWHHVCNELAHLAEKGLEGLNIHLEHQINNLETQRRQRFTTDGATANIQLSRDGTARESYENFVSEYIEGINQELTKTILERFQQDLAEPATHVMAETSLMYGFERMFEDKRKATLSILQQNSSQPSNSQREERRPGTSATAHENNNQNYYGNVHMDNVVQNSESSQTVRQLHQEHGDNLRVYVDKHGRCYADL